MIVRATSVSWAMLGYRLKRHVTQHSQKEDTSFEVYQHVINVFRALLRVLFRDHFLVHYKLAFYVLQMLLVKIAFELDPSNYTGSPGMAWDGMML